MGRERWFRGDREERERSFDWYALARERGIDAERALSLHDEAVRRATLYPEPGLHLEPIYVELIEAAQRAAWQPAPGKVTRTMRLQARAAGKRRRTGPVAPGKVTLSSYYAQAGRPGPGDRGRAPQGGTGIQPVLRHAEGAVAWLDPAALDQAVESGGGMPLPAALRHRLEQHFGADLEAVRIHTDGRAQAAARSVAARAFAAGTSIFFGAGQYAPHTDAGWELLVHEVAHVVQWQQGRVAGARDRVAVSDPADPLEKEAEAASRHIPRVDAEAGPAPDGARRRARPGARGVARPGARRVPAARAGRRMILRHPFATEGPERRLSEEGEAQLRQALQRLGVRDLGDTSGLRQWPFERLDRAWQTLSTLARGGQALSPEERQRRRAGRWGAGAREGGEQRRPYHGRIVEAWNRRLDDLGSEDRYANILAFVDTLEGLSRSSMRTDYLTAVSRMPDVRLAGARVGVHPRALWFAAAAQVGMDDGARERGEREGMGNGDGHYVPAGGFRAMLVDVRRMAGQLGFAAIGRRGRRDRPGPVRRGGAIFAALTTQIRRARAVMAAQQAGQDTGAHGHDEHREPALRDFLLAQGRFDRVPENADDQTAPEAARALYDALEGIPGGGAAHHGFGSIDPHGTDHAMGLAVDIYNGRGAQGHHHNFGIPQDYLPFLYRLIDRHPGEDLPAGTRFRSVHHLEPAQARALSRLVRDHGGSEREAILQEGQGQEGQEDGAGEERDTPAQRARHLRAFQGLQGRIRLALRRRIQPLTRARSAPGFDAETRAEIDAMLGRLRRDVDTVPELGPAELTRHLRERIAQLDALCRDGAEDQTQADTDARAELDEDLRAIDEAEAEAAGQAERTRGAQAERLKAQMTAAAGELADLAEQHAAARGPARARLQRQRAQARARLRAATDALRRLQQRARQQSQQRERRFARERARLQRLADRASGRRDAGEASLAAAHPDSGQSLRALLSELETQGQAAAQAYQHQQTERLREIVRTRRFARWLQDASNADHPLYDQPEVMTEGLDSVHAFPDQGAGHARGRDTHFYGGHHWQVAPERVLQSERGYQDSLQHDMRPRPPEQIEAILRAMAESDGGRRALWGADEAGTGRDTVLRRALDERLGGDAVEGMLERVRQRVVAAYEGEDGTSGQIQRDLRDRGFYVADGEGG